MSTPQQLLWYAEYVPRVVAQVNARATRTNTQCGDTCALDLCVTDGRVVDVRVVVDGCAVCRGVAGWLHETVPGTPVAALLAWTPLHAVTSWGLTLGPLRRKCAALPVETLHAALAAHQCTDSSQ